MVFIVIEIFLSDGMTGITLLLFLAYTSAFLVILFIFKIIIPLKKIKENQVQKHTYYRDKIDQYSPLMNAKLLGKDIFDQDVITAMILYLKSKGWQEMRMIDDTSVQKKQFMENEFVFIKNQHNLFMSINNKKEESSQGITAKEKIEKAVLEDLKKEGLIRYIPSLRQLQMIDILPFLFFMLNIITLIKIGNISKQMNIFLLIIEVLINISWILIYFLSIYFKLHLRSNLEKKGQIYVNKLYASKEFLTDFSIISQRGIKEDALWGSYLRNAILFDLKGSLDKEATEYYHEIISGYSYYNPKKKTSILKLFDYFLGFIANCIFLGIMMSLLLVSFFNDYIFFIILINFIVFPIIYFSFIKYLYPYSPNR